MRCWDSPEPGPTPSRSVLGVLLALIPRAINERQVGAGRRTLIRNDGRQQSGSNSALTSANNLRHAHVPQARTPWKKSLDPRREDLGVQPHHRTLRPPLRASSLSCGPPRVTALENPPLGEPKDSRALAPKR